MGVSFTVQRGSKNSVIVADTTNRELGRNKAFVQITHSGVCGTDEHYRHAGMVLGHEGAGIVRAIGTSVKAVKVGDRVGFGYIHKICGQCENCLTGQGFDLIVIKHIQTSDAADLVHRHGCILLEQIGVRKPRS